MWFFIILSIVIIITIIVLARKGVKQKIDYSNSPTAVFKSLGSNTLLKLWNNLVKGQNQAVFTFDRFKTFYNALEREYTSINFDRTLLELNFNEDTLIIQAQHGMYLYMLNLENDYYVTTEANIQQSYLLTIDMYKKIINCLSKDELSYCDELVKYIKDNIYPYVEETDVRRYGINLCKSIIPQNLLSLHKYHTFISEENYSSESEEYKKYHHIECLPSLVNYNSTDNPLILTELTAINAFVLDYLCYGTICLPTLDITKVLSYRTQAGETIEAKIVSRFGQEAIEYILNVIDDMNGSMFRVSVYSGALIQ